MSIMTRPDLIWVSIAIMFQCVCTVAYGEDKMSFTYKEQIIKGIMEFGLYMPMGLLRPVPPKSLFPLLNRSTFVRKLLLFSTHRAVLYLKLWTSAARSALRGLIQR